MDHRRSIGGRGTQVAVRTSGGGSTSILTETTRYTVRAISQPWGQRRGCSARRHAHHGRATTTQVLASAFPTPRCYSTSTQQAAADSIHRSPNKKLTKPATGDSLPEPSTDSSPTAAEFFGNRRLDSTKIDQYTKMIQSFWRHVLNLWEALPCFHGPHACFFFSIPSIKVLGFSTTECSLNVDP